MTSTRREILAALAGATLLPSVAVAGPDGPEVLFVCQFGTVKSAIAKELFRRRAVQRGIAVHVLSRGISPEEHLSPELERQLAADGIKPKAEPVVRLGTRDVAGADLVVAFDPLPADLKPKAMEDWTAVPSMLRQYPAARAELDRRIDALLDRIQTGRLRPTP